MITGLEKDRFFCGKLQAWSSLFFEELHLFLQNG